ncbi:hypothetical protein [Phenylobacterium sp.]|uniref:hypothetical protein n=1 Tax=Phenylobacterium sp. TaxID=1871053 RepID=UPI002CE17591|nr:hypothetical protein [Phenylobacterium sp.]HLZ76312.1 hypothetical protein [Phenylobacterium sp.]
MGKLIAGTVICAAICTGAAVAAPARAVGVDTPQDQGPQAQQVYLRETQKVTARAQLIYKLADNAPAAEGRAEVVERSQGLVVYEPAAAPAADPQVRPASPVHTTTTSTVSWTPAPALPTPRSF